MSIEMQKHQEVTASFEEVMWVRHDNDQGMWWPALFVANVESRSLLVTAVRHHDTESQQRATGASRAAVLHVTSASPTVPLFWRPYGGKPVVATEWCAYDESSQRAGMAPPNARTVERFEEKAVHQMNSIRSGHGAADSSHGAAPVTPSPMTLCGNVCPTITPASSSSDAASPGDTSQSSRASSPASSTCGTELDLTPTQLSPGTDERPALSPLANSNAAHSDTPTARTLESTPATQVMGWHKLARQRNAGEGGRQSISTAGGTPPRTRGAKRARAVNEVRFLGENRKRIIGEVSPAASRPSRNTRSRKECVDNNQYPRLGSPPASAAGHVLYRSQCASNNSPDVKLRPVEDGGDFSAAVEREGGRVDSPCAMQIEEQHSRYCQQRQALSETESELSGDEEPILCDKRMTRQQHRTEHNTIPVTGLLSLTQQETPRETVPVPSRGGHEKSQVGGADICGASSVDAVAQEAAAFRDVGITGREQEFKDIRPKLMKLKWRWGPAIDKSATTSELWFMKPKTNIKTATHGVDKFEPNEHVVEYVRSVLARSEEVNSDGEDEGTEKEDEGNGYGEGEAETGEDCEHEHVDSGSVDVDERLTGVGAQPESQEIRELEDALEALSPANAPAAPNQREGEFNEVLQFLTDGIKKSAGGSMYLCGCPGTGKTMTMSLVQQELQNGRKTGLPVPEFHTFTGTAFTNPSTMHGDLWRAISGQTDRPVDVEKAISMKLQRKGAACTARSPMIVVVVDEIDQLHSHNRQVLRKLFEWAAAPKSRLLLVGIANSIEFDVAFDLRKPPTKICFRAYSPSDLAGILEQRVGSVMDKGALTLCSKKVAATHGDARRAITICREAVSIAKRAVQAKIDQAAAEAEQSAEDTQSTETAQADATREKEKAPVTIVHMQQALKGARACRHGDAMVALSTQAQIVLCVAAASARESEGRRDRPDGAKMKRSKLTQGTLHEKCMHRCAKANINGWLSQIEFSGTIDMLAAQGLVDVRGKQSTGRARELALHVEWSDVEIALGNLPFFKDVTA